jgi:hypothetical protein
MAVTRDPAAKAQCFITEMNAIRNGVFVSDAFALPYQLIDLTSGELSRRPAPREVLRDDDDGPGYEDEWIPYGPLFRHRRGHRARLR